MRLIQLCYCTQTMFEINCTLSENQLTSLPRVEYGLYLSSLSRARHYMLLHLTLVCVLPAMSHCGACMYPFRLNDIIRIYHGVNPVSVTW
jgi:hypothetical protein